MACEGMELCTALLFLQQFPWLKEEHLFAQVIERNRFFLVLFLALFVLLLLGEHYYLPLLWICIRSCP